VYAKPWKQHQRSKEIRFDGSIIGEKIAQLAANRHLDPMRGIAIHATEATSSSIASGSTPRSERDFRRIGLPTEERVSKGEVEIER
jgi:hypothetical protein